LPALPPAEQRVAKLLLLDARSFASLPVSELADRSHVSKPTVVRFCRSVGYDGLADFKLKLAGSVNEGVPFVHRAVDEDDKTADIIVKVVDNAVAALLHYRNDAAGHAFERAIDALTDSARHNRRIEFYGVGNSGIVAQDAQHKFFRLGVNTVATSDGHVQLMSATMLSAGRLRWSSSATRAAAATCWMRPRSRARRARPSSSSRPAPRRWRSWRWAPARSCWRWTTRRISTATARWCRGCCT
jgi:RpiR family carbohydrate utilization transcriptional regulator